RVRRAACAAHVARRYHGARAGDHGTRGIGRRRGRPLPQLREHRAAALRQGGHRIRTRAPLRARMTLRVLNPATGEAVAELDQAGVEDTDRAVAAAHAAFPAWRALNPRDRARLLRRFAVLVEEHGEELARLETRNVGKRSSAPRGGVG